MKINLNGVKPVFYIPMIIGIFILTIIFSLAWFALGYWLITLILAEFFNYILPFSYNYVLGGWLITLIIGVFISPFLGIKVNVKN